VRREPLNLPLDGVSVVVEVDTAFSSPFLVIRVGFSVTFRVIVSPFIAPLFSSTSRGLVSWLHHHQLKQMISSKLRWIGEAKPPFSFFSIHFFISQREALWLHAFLCMLGIMNANHTNISGFASLAYRVRQGQSTLCRSKRRVELHELLQRKTWDELSQVMAAQFFPMAKKKQLTIQLSESAKIIKMAFALFPLQYKIRGHVQPDWSTQTFLSWMRRSTAPQTKQFYFSEYEIDEEPQPEQAYMNLQNIAKVEKSDALSFIGFFHSLDDLAASESVRAELAKLVYLPWAFAHIDQANDEQMKFTAYPPQRKILREMKQGTVSYARIGRRVFLFGDRYAAKRHSTPNGWVDIREGATISYNDFFIKWQSEGKKQVLNFRINFSHIKELEAEAKPILKSKANTTRKAMMLNDQARKIRNRYRYSAGTSSQLFELDKKISKLFRKHLQANDPNLKYAGCRPTYERKLLIPKPNPFADVDRVSLDFWKAMFSPYRLR